MGWGWLGGVEDGRMLPSGERAARTGPRNVSAQPERCLHGVGSERAPAAASPHRRDAVHVWEVGVRLDDRRGLLQRKQGRWKGKTAGRKVGLGGAGLSCRAVTQAVAPGSAAGSLGGEGGDGGPDVPAPA